MQIKAEALFPVPVFHSKIVPDNVDDVKNDLESTHKRLIPNYGMSQTGPLIHEQKVYKNLVEKIESYVDTVFSEHLNFLGIKPYVCAMWSNCQHEKAYLGIHIHPNSFYSGVWYPFGDIDPIIFVQDSGPGPNATCIIDPKIGQRNEWNSPTLAMNPEENQCLLFPSNLKHRTGFKSGEGVRYSISFNIFISGELGHKKRLDYLELL
jgi:uncharacterized protein (TIGR02466 family)